ncbi:MAG: hypothetical protein AAF726_12000 [Planctomycetota bacterium]
MLTTLFLATTLILPPATSHGAATSAPVADDLDDQLRKLGREYKKAKTTEDRRVVLERVAQLGKDTEGPPPPAVAKFLAGSIDAEDLEMRRRSIELLLDGQDPEVVVEAVLDAWKIAEKEAKWTLKQLHAMNKERRRPKVGGLAQEDMARMTEAVALSSIVLRAFGSLPDERVEDALVDILRTKPKDMPVHVFGEASRAALELGTVKTLQAYAKCADELDRMLAGKGVPVRFERSGPVTLLDALQAPWCEVNERVFEETAAAAVAISETRGLTRPPDVGSKDRKAWRRWVEANEESLIGELGRLTEPVEADLADDED